MEWFSFESAMPTRLLTIAFLICIVTAGIDCSKKLTATELPDLNRQLFKAVDHRDIASVRRLLRSGANLETTGYNDMTPLGAAASNGDLPMVQFLIENGAKPHVKDHSLETPLMHASYGGHTEVVRLLLTQNPDLAEKSEALLEAAHGEPAIVVINDAQNDQSASDLARQQAMSAEEAPWVETVKLLLNSGADIEATDEYRGPPLIQAAGYAQTNVVVLLLERGANLNARDKYGNTALIAASCECAVATMNDAYDVVNVLLDKGSDVNAHSDDGTTALMNAAGGFGGSAIVKLLLERGADPRARDSKGRTALKFALENRKDKAQLIEQALAKTRAR